MTSILDADEVRGGLRAADAFWRALGRDEDPVLEDLLTPEALTVLGAGPGLGVRIREQVGITSELCSCLGPVSPVPLSQDRSMRPTYAFTSIPISGSREGQDAAWSIAVIDREGVWCIDPTAADPLLEVGHRWLSLSMVWSKITTER